MNFPRFKRSRSFIQDLNVPCLKATIRNSAIPKLAARHIARFVDEPEFDIFLRAQQPGQITPWQQTILERLFEREELALAIQQGMEDFLAQTDYDDLVDYEKRAWDDIKLNGALPHLELLFLVVDDIEQQVIFSLRV